MNQEMTTKTDEEVTSLSTTTVIKEHGILPIPTTGIEFITEAYKTYKSPEWCVQTIESSPGTSVFNLLTMPNIALVSKLPEPEVKTGNLKDESKIAEKVSKAKANQIEDMAFNPLWGRCAGICIQDLLFNYDEAPALHDMVLVEDSDTAEYTMLVSFFNAVNTRRVVPLSWTGLDFEIPFIWQRAMILGVPSSLIPVSLTLSELMKRENINYSVREMCTFSHKSESLGVLAEMLLEEKQVALGAPVQQLVSSDPYDQISITEHCRQNVYILAGLLRKFAGFLIPATTGTME